MQLNQIYFGIKAPFSPEPVFPRDLFEVINLFHLCLSQLLSKLTFNLTIFNFLVIMKSFVQNKSVVNWLKRSQLYSGSHRTFCQPLLNSEQKKVWPPDCLSIVQQKYQRLLLEEKPICMKLVVAVGYLSCTLVERREDTQKKPCPKNHACLKRTAKKKKTIERKHQVLLRRVSLGWLLWRLPWGCRKKKEEKKQILDINSKTFCYIN